MIHFLRNTEMVFHWSQSWTHKCKNFRLATLRWTPFCSAFLIFSSGGYRCHHHHHRHWDLQLLLPLLITTTTTTTATATITTIFTHQFTTRANKPGVVEECLAIASLLTGVTTWVTTQVCIIIMFFITTITWVATQTCVTTTPSSTLLSNFCSPWWPGLGHYRFLLILGSWSQHSAENILFSGKTGWKGGLFFFFPGTDYWLIDTLTHFSSNFGCTFATRLTRVTWYQAFLLIGKDFKKMSLKSQTFAKPSEGGKDFL